MNNDQNTLVIVYSVPEHCGHEVIHRIFLTLEEAQKYVYPINESYSKDFSFWDGSPYAFEIKTKYVKDGKVEEWEGCDLCGYHCKCLGDSPRKTEQAYNAYWTPERSNHVHEHFYKRTYVDTCNFCIDPNDNYNSLRWKTTNPITSGEDRS